MVALYNNNQNFIPTEGSTITLGDTLQNNFAIINATGALNVLNAVMPATPHPGQQVLFASTYPIAAFTPSGGSTTFTTVAIQAMGYVSYEYDFANSCWMLTGLNGAPMATQAYTNGVKYNNVFPYFASAVVSGGIATFYLTDNGLSSGNAVFKNSVFTQSINLITQSTTTQYQYGSFTVAPGNKSISVSVTQIALSLGAIVFTNAANGVVVYLQINGY